MGVADEDCDSYLIYNPPLTIQIHFQAVWNEKPTLVVPTSEDYHIILGYAAAHALES